MVHDNYSVALAAKKWIKAETPYFLEHLADELGSLKLAKKAWSKIKAEAKNEHIEELSKRASQDRYNLNLEARMDELYNDPTELANYVK